MEDKILLKADLKRHKGSLIGVFTLVLLVCGALCTVLSVWINSGRYIRTEMERDALARDGAMLHVFRTDTGSATDSQLNRIINEDTELPAYTEFLHSGSSKK